MQGPTDSGYPKEKVQSPSKSDGNVQGAGELLPCPFCGSEITRHNLRGIHFKWVVCHECGVEGPCKDTTDEAIHMWNLRSISPPIVSGVAIPQEDSSLSETPTPHSEATLFGQVTVWEELCREAFPLIDNSLNWWYPLRESDGEEPTETRNQLFAFRDKLRATLREAGPVSSVGNSSGVSVSLPNESSLEGSAATATEGERN